MSPGWRAGLGLSGGLWNRSGGIPAPLLTSQVSSSAALSLHLSPQSTTWNYERIKYMLVCVQHLDPCLQLLGFP